MPDLERMRDVEIDVALSAIEDTVRGSLATGFAHGPLTIKDYQQYEERCRWAATVIRAALTK